MNPTVSIVVPTYKVEKFLARCVDSLLSQTYRETEIVLVDDGSPDACPVICDEYAAKSTGVVVVHKPNGGLSSARNAGMEIVAGKYLFFVDSDDWIDPDCIADLVAVAEREQVDFVRTRMKYSGWPNHTDGSVCDFGIEDMMTEGLYDREKIEKEILPISIATRQITFGPIISSCATLYRTELFGASGVRFYEDVKYSEDCIFNVRTLFRTKSFYYLNSRQYYNYFFNNTSITKSFRADRWESHKRQIERFEEDFGQETRFDVRNQLWLKRMFCILNALSERDYIRDMAERKKYCNRICKDPVTVEAMKHLDLARVPRKLYIVLLLIKHKQGWLLAKI